MAPVQAKRKNWLIGARRSTDYCQKGRISATISGMSIRSALSRQRGFSALVVPFALAVVFLITAVVFGGWAYAKMLDYKNNVDAKITIAVTTAKQQEDAVKDAAFAQQEKQPLKAYTGPTAYGSLTINYPKTWSAYVIDTRNSSPFIDGYFYPNVVPDTQSANSSFALRVQMVQDSYSTVLNSLSTYVQSGKAKVTPYSAPKVSSVVGARVDGSLSGSKSGSMIVLPVRNMTLKIWTEAPQFQNDFNSNILPNFTFAP